MKIIHPDNLLDPMKEKLANPLTSRHSGTINTLYASPEFARHPEIYPLLIKGLHDTRWLVERNYIAMILHKIGDPLGILHLTYNCLTTHPILKIRQDDLHGWSSGWLLVRADSLTEECIDLLIEDLKNPYGYLHVDVLSAVPADKIVPRMLPLLEAEGKAAMAAACVLAMKGRDEGRSILERLAETQKYVEFALIALSHIPDAKTLHYFRTYADPQHAIYQRYKNSFISTLLRHAEARLFLLECQDPYPVRRTLERFYLHPLQTLMAYEREWLRIDGKESAARWIQPPSDFNPRFFVINSHLTSSALGTGVSAPNFLYEFATAEDRAYCAEIQRKSIRALLDLKTIDWAHLGNGDDMGIEPKFFWSLHPTGDEYRSRNFNLPGFKITYELEDYERAATEWILEPQKYCFSFRYSLANYESDPRPKEPEWRENVKFADPNSLRRISKLRGRKRGTDIVNSLPLLPPETFFRPFADLSAVDPFAGFDRKALPPMYDEHGYLTSLDTGAKFYAHAWRKRDYGDPNINDLSITVAWESSEKAAMKYQATLAKRTASASQPFSQLTLAACDALISRTYQLNESESILQLVARYKNYVFNLVVSIKPEGYFPSTEAFVPYALAFDQHVASILSKAV